MICSQPDLSSTEELTEKLIGLDYGQKLTPFNKVIPLSFGKETSTRAEVRHTRVLAMLTHNDDSILTIVVAGAVRFERVWMCV